MLSEKQYSIADLKLTTSFEDSEMLKWAIKALLHVRTEPILTFEVAALVDKMINQIAKFNTTDPL